jgi:phosphatidylethanolamine/phosphatidyl-N-methylethanolamine N-methyltransferase
MNIIARDLETGVVARAYHHWAQVYDQLCGPVFRRAHVAAAAAATRIGGSVLEVGVGTGLLLPLYGANVRVTGVDLSETMLSRARARVAKTGLDRVDDLVIGDIHVLDHADESYNAVVMPFVLTLVESPEVALDNALRMLKPGGEIIVVSHFQSRAPAIAGFERAIAPMLRGVGLRPDFPIARVEAWAATHADAQFLPPEGLGRFSVYTLLRIRKRQALKAG